ncbi:MAG: hypothetical protein ACKOOI_02620, partial [Pirellula sp.]
HHPICYQARESVSPRTKLTTQNAIDSPKPPARESPGNPGYLPKLPLFTLNDYWIVSDIPIY